MARSDQLAIALNAQRKVFKAFLVARVGSEADADDILQIGLLKAFQNPEELHDSGKLTAWFYRLLRNSIIDLYRSRSATDRRDQVLSETLAALEGSEEEGPFGWKSKICACLGPIIKTLKPTSAELIRRVDLNRESVQDVAGSLGLTPNNASVVLLRARRDLRRKLHAFCGACAEGACLDCECKPVKDNKNRIPRR